MYSGTANLNLLKAQNDSSKIALNLQKERFKVLQDTKRTQENIDESRRKQAASKVIAGLGRDVTQAQAELADLQRFDNLSTQDSRVEKQKEIIKLDTLTLDLMGNEGRKNVLNRFNIEKMCFNTYSEYKKLIN